MKRTLLVLLLVLLGCSSSSQTHSGQTPDAGPAYIEPVVRKSLGGGPSGGQYLLTPKTLVDGEIAPPLLDVNGRAVVADPNLSALLSAASAAPSATTLLVSTQLPASGAYQAAPTAADAGVVMPTGTVALPTRACGFIVHSVLGDGGTSSSQASCKFWAEAPTDDGGIVWAQVAEPVNQGFGGYPLQADIPDGGSAVEVILQIPAIADRVWLTCAEIGTTSSPVVLSAWVRCR